MNLDLGNIPWEPGSGVRITTGRKHELVFAQEFPFMLRFFRFPHGVNATPNFHDYLEMTLVFRGDVTFHVESSAFPVGPGDVLLVGNREFHRLEISRPETEAHVACLFLMPEFICASASSSLDYELLRPFRTRNLRSKVVPAKGKAARIFVESIPVIQDLLSKGGILSQIAVKNKVREILLEILQSAKTEAPETAESRRADQDFERLKKVFYFLQMNFQKQILLQTVADVACMSASYFCRNFKKNTGRTLKEFVLGLRIDKARELLLQTDMSITQIAFEVGFSNHSYFDEIFRRFVRCSPLEYRKSGESRTPAGPP